MFGQIWVGAFQTEKINSDNQLINKPVSLATLSELKSAGYRIVGHCTHPYCGVGRTLKLDDLIDRLGPDYVVINEARIARNFLCQSPQCEHAQRGQRGGSITLHPPT